MTSVDVKLWAAWQAAWLVFLEGDMSRVHEVTKHFEQMILAVALLRTIHVDNLETASFLASWACILDQSIRDLFATIDSLATIETFLKYDPSMVCSTMDKIHNLFFDKAVSVVRARTITCAESCDLLSELLPLIDQDRAACN